MVQLYFAGATAISTRAKSYKVLPDGVSVVKGTDTEFFKQIECTNTHPMWTEHWS